MLHGLVLLPDAASTFFPSSGNEKSAMKELLEEKFVPSLDSLNVTLLWCGHVVFSCNECRIKVCMNKSLNHNSLSCEQL